MCLTGGLQYSIQQTLHVRVEILWLGWSFRTAKYRMDSICIAGYGGAI
jgi:hypothetical protein